MKRFDATALAIPTFVLGDAYVVGYVKGETDKRLRALVAAALQSRRANAGQDTTSVALNTWRCEPEGQPLLMGEEPLRAQYGGDTRADDDELFGGAPAGHLRVVE